MPKEYINIKGASQNNLRHVSARLPLHKMIVVTGVSGSGKSSLAFDTVYAEGQRRYVETFSPYARQFLDRMDKPQVEKISGIPPAIAIDQTNPVRTSRSTVGTMTELNDRLKLLFARAARLYCGHCNRVVKRDTPDTIYDELIAAANNITESGQKPILTIAFPVPVPANFSVDEIRAILEKQGYRRIKTGRANTLEVSQSRIPLTAEHRQRTVDDLEHALKHGHGKVIAHISAGNDDDVGTIRRFSTTLHCPDCDIDYQDPLPNLFSFNSPIGACETCRGFGRIIGVDYSLVVPDDSKPLAEGAIKPWQTQSYQECQDDLLRFARLRKIPANVPWRDLSAAQRDWVLSGEGSWEDGLWYGVKRFFDWLETKAYRMHIRVLLSKYRAYHLCPACNGARLKPEALRWRLGPAPGHSMHDIMMMPIGKCRRFIASLTLPPPFDEASALLMDEIRTRLQYLAEVGLDYLTLDRQSRTLSGGEVQRINLTTALGTSLVNTLFVLDEPSIGLHPRDIQRLVQILHRLRDAGNSLLIVEHDPAVIRAADEVVDMGPGPGEHGGQKVFHGSVAALLHCPDSLTADYLTGRRMVSIRQPAIPPADGPALVIRGATEHNLKNIDVRIPLGHLVCITGVSGSGKSTLIQDVCYAALRKLKHNPVETPGQYRELLGHELIDDVILVDQSPIGKTTRSNPASYVGALGTIRGLFAQAPLARQRQYTAGTFSFNSGKGRCPTCGGNGFQHVEMQFLSDVYLRCPDCDGKRYRTEILEVKLDGQKSIADILDMTVSEACDFFAARADVLRGLEPLRSVGLDYLRLGQPVPTLSGGEAQRLKLAGHLADSGKSRKNRCLFLFDEPTTGLHFHDIAVLLTAFDKLLQEGHSIAVIEHNLDVVGAADWIIDLGPEGGDEGGHLVCCGTPEHIMACTESHTGAALRDYLGANRMDKAVAEAHTVYSPAAAGPRQRQAESAVIIHNAREHNLQGIDVRIPRDKFTVITGISGSGKSTVAFDILFAEGQRRYLESLNAYARQFVQPASRPDVDAVLGVPPTVAIEQRTSRGGRKSTVATVTEIYHFLRLLFVKLGTQYCPDCALPIEPQTAETILASLMRDWGNRRVTLLAPLVIARKGYYTDLAKWAARKGFAELLVDGQLIPTEPWPRLDRFHEHTIHAPVGTLKLSPANEGELRTLIDLALSLGEDVLHVIPAGRPGTAPAIFSSRRACPGCNRSFPELDPRFFSYNSKHGWCPRCYGIGLLMKGFDAEQSGEEIWWNEWWEGGEKTCPACQGKRLRPEALAVTFHDRSIADFAALSVQHALQAFASMKLTEAQKIVARDILQEITSRLTFLSEVGLAYLSLDRAMPTLSGGEAQRIRLASQLGSNLRGVCYILDEPTIGLHARDNLRLLDTLHKLEAKGNTVVVVEHDETTIRRAEHIIDLGPGAGVNGGHVVVTGTPEQVMAAPDSLTGRYLREPLRHPIVRGRRPVSRQSTGAKDMPAITVRKASLHNLRNLDVVIPLGRLICVTGVSGSGKSTLVRDVLHDNLKRQCQAGRRRRQQHAKAIPFTGCQDIRGTDLVSRVLEVDQTPIGKTPRSCPATYVGFWDQIRQLFAATPEARMRGYQPGRFSFNVRGGRCEACEGQGIRKIEMSFLPDVTVTCEACGGRRFNPETLAVLYNDRTIADVLAMSVDEAAQFFAALPRIRRPLQLLQEVGLGYLTLGQQSPTLSGGEAQRIKLVSELAKADSTPAGTAAVRTAAALPKDHTLYVLDEPTIGLHMADVQRLVLVLHRLVNAGHTVIVIEHNMDVISEADWVIDLGPEGGDEGGRVVAQGTPHQLARVRHNSSTGPLLSEFLHRDEVRKTSGNE